MASGTSAPNMCAHVDVFVCPLEQSRNVATLVCRSVPSGQHAHVRGFHSCYLPHAAPLLIAVKLFWFLFKLYSHLEKLEIQILKSKFSSQLSFHKTFLITYKNLKKIVS